MRRCCSCRLLSDGQPTPFPKVLEEHQDYHFQRISQRHSPSPSSVKHPSRMRRLYAAAAFWSARFQKSSPSLPERRQSLEIILIFDPALYPEIGQDRHHLPQGDSGKLGSSAQRCFAFLVSFHRE